MRAGTLGVVPPGTPGCGHAPEWLTPDPCCPAPLLKFLRSTLLPAVIVLLFGLALLAVSARIWLPSDMAAPAPIA